MVIRAGTLRMKGAAGTGEREAGKQQACRQPEGCCRLSPNELRTCGRKSAPAGGGAVVVILSMELTPNRRIVASRLRLSVATDHAL